MRGASRRLRQESVRAGLAVYLVALLGLASASTAEASTTIGQLAPGSPPPTNCSPGTYDALNQTITSGNTFTVPAGGQAITSWSTNAAAGAGQMLTMKVFRKIADPATYMVVGHDGPRPLTPGTLNSFPANVPVQPGDLLGLAVVGSSSTACSFPVPGQPLLERLGDLGDGQSAVFNLPMLGARLNVSAVVGFKPSNAFSFGKVKRNKRKGTATLAVSVPGPGTLTLTGKGVKAQRTGRAARTVASKTVGAAGTVKLKIKPKGKTRRKLTDTGRAKVKVKVTFTPNGTATGDVIGDPNTKSKRVKLVKQG
jgi:hypothetical protein